MDTATLFYTCKCGEELNFSAEQAGELTRCPSCQKPFMVAGD